MTSREELYEKAQELDIEGRSSMSKQELQAAVSKTEGASKETFVDDLAEQEAKSEDFSGAEKAAREDLGLAGITTTLNGERAASGDPLVTHADVVTARQDPDAARDVVDSQ